MVDCSIKKLALLILIVATCIEIAFLLSMVTYWRLLREELLEDKQQQQQLCYSLDRIFTNSDDKDTCPEGLKINRKHDTKTCCGNLDLILDNLVTKVVSEKYNSDANPELPSLDLKLDQCNVTRMKPPMVKLVELARDKNPEGNSSKIFWNPNIQMYATSGLTYMPDEGTVCVLKTGYYFIHSQLKVKVVSTNDTDYDVRDIFTHNVHLIPIEKDTSSIILEDRNSQCEMASKESEITSAVGGVFWLEQEDRLYVATSHPTRLVQRDNCIVFSMHSL
ncbi:uncharacterized protein LOC123554704 isoform X2 [Mercenaria mercenaria]|uniref:uncharacterized protein LOC123554704 isoform X2 n=1 Tax=Mercenaria mercenaria TaxID=6596 RepID=UPI00234FB558|nr:uncharacterized protein LOC123554704 isoform X2 [Mercenaria mercenaria]